MALQLPGTAAALLRCGMAILALYSLWAAYVFVRFHNEMHIRTVPLVSEVLPAIFDSTVEAGGGSGASNAYTAGYGSGAYHALQEAERTVEGYLRQKLGGAADAGNDGGGRSSVGMVRNLFRGRGKDGGGADTRRSTDERQEVRKITRRVKRGEISPFVSAKLRAERYLAKIGPEKLRRSLSAYIEPTMQDRNASIPYDQGDKNDQTSKGFPPRFVLPLPLRTQTPDDLHVFRYPNVQTCSDLPARWPVDEGMKLSKDGKPLFTNVNNREPIKDPLLDAVHCPVNADPFLPWIHDVFPSRTGEMVHFIAQNKRRCNTGNRFLKDLERLEPQVAIMQPISVQRITDHQANELAPQLWRPALGDGDTNTTDVRGETPPRFRLAPHDEGDPDGQYTRFICRFRQTLVNKEDDDGNGNGEPRSVLLGDTLSHFPINYEFANYRKFQATYHSMLTPKGKDNPQFWLSSQRFDCPVPDVPGLAAAISSGNTVLSDGTPLVHLDLVPIRTSPRFGVQEVYFTEDLAGDPKAYGSLHGDKHGWSKYMGKKRGDLGFDARARWGDRNVLPRIEASGRWANVPICKPPPPISEGGGGKASIVETVASAVRDENNNDDESDDDDFDESKKAGRNESSATKKKHTIIGCLWASASYTTRGHENAISDTTERLIEWIEFNLMVGMDHIYVYDNTGAHTEETDLSETLARFSSSEVTRINWPARPCNNNVPAHENTGERSSQYAAEASCRERYGSHSEWVAAIDPDEYIVPMGKYSNLKDLLRDAKEGGTEILGFKSTRALPNANYMLPYHDDEKCGSEANPQCLQKSPDRLFLETYNCDVEDLPKPHWSTRAKKQIYNPSYVLSHFVHYSTITEGLVESCKSLKLRGKACDSTNIDASTERIANEKDEAVMIHSKTMVPRDSVDWRERCQPDFKASHGKKCRVGFPVPNYDESKFGESDQDGMKYNCYSYEKVSDYYLPRLREAMKNRQERYENRKAAES